MLSILLSLVHFYFELLKISEISENDEEVFARLLDSKLEGSKVKRIRGLSIISLVLRRFGRVNGLVMSS